MKLTLLVLFVCVTAAYALSTLVPDNAPAPYTNYNPLLGTFYEFGPPDVQCSILPESYTDRISKLFANSGGFLDSFGVEYTRLDGSVYNSVRCGNTNGGDAQSPLVLQADENINRLDINTDEAGGNGLVTTFTTSQGQSQVLGVFVGPDNSMFSVPSDERVIGFRVVSNYFVSRLHVVTYSSTQQTTTTTTPPTCNSFDITKYGAKKPDITATAAGSTATIAVTMYRQSVANDVVPVFHNLDTTETGATTCRSSGDNVVSSASSNWVVTSTGCAVTYTLTQTLAQITAAGADNHWTATLASDGRSILYTVPVFATYSVNSNGCYYVGFRSTISFQTVLSVDSTSTSFVTADNSAKYQFSGLRMYNGNLEVAGTIVPLVPNSELRNIVLSQNGGVTFTSVPNAPCSAYNTGCSQGFTAPLSAFGAGADISGVYTTVMDVFENSIRTRQGVTITYSLSYQIPTDPSVVDSDTITTGNTLYESDYTTPRTSSYISATNSLYIENKITSNVAIPAGYKLRMTEGYVCCTSYLSSITSCKTQSIGDGLIEKYSLGSESTQPVGVQFTSADSLTNKKSYRLQVALNAAYLTTNHATPLTCQVQLFSKLDSGARSLNGASNLDSTYVSTKSFSVESQQVVASASITSVSIAMIVVLIVGMIL